MCGHTWSSGLPRKGKRHTVHRLFFSIVVVTLLLPETRAVAQQPMNILPWAHKLLGHSVDSVFPVLVERFGPTDRIRFHSTRVFAHGTRRDRVYPVSKKRHERLYYSKEHGVIGVLDWTEASELQVIELHSNAFAVTNNMTVGCTKNAVLEAFEGEPSSLKHCDIDWAWHPLGTSMLDSRGTLRMAYNNRKKWAKGLDLITYPELGLTFYFKDDIVARIELRSPHAWDAASGC